MIIYPTKRQYKGDIWEQRWCLNHSQHRHRKKEAKRSSSAEKHTLEHLLGFCDDFWCRFWWCKLLTVVTYCHRTQFSRPPDQKLKKWPRWDLGNYPLQVLAEPDWLVYASRWRKVSPTTVEDTYIFTTRFRHSWLSRFEMIIDHPGTPIKMRFRLEQVLLDPISISQPSTDQLHSF